MKMGKNVFSPEFQGNGLNKRETMSQNNRYNLKEFR